MDEEEEEEGVDEEEEEEGMDEKEEEEELDEEEKEEVNEEEEKRFVVSDSKTLPLILLWLYNIVSLLPVYFTSKLVDFVVKRGMNQMKELE